MSQAIYCGALFNVTPYGMHIVRTGGPTRGQVHPIEINADGTLAVGDALTYENAVCRVTMNGSDVDQDHLCQIVEVYYAANPAEAAKDWHDDLMRNR